MKKIIKWLFPKYTIIPLLTIFIFNMLTYFGTKLINLNRFHHDITNIVNINIPFISFFFIFYFLAYAQWAIGFILVARENKKLCYEFLSGEFIAKLISLMIFIIIPTTMIRPDIAEINILDKAVGFLYKIDTPRNLFPSLHCLESWLCFRGALKLKSIRKWYAPLSFVFTVMVFASTILIKQHVPLDIVAGILVAELGLLISKLTRAGKIFENINLKLGLASDNNQ